MGGERTSRAASGGARSRTGWMTAGMGSRGRRLLSAAVAIVLGVTFLTASLVVVGTAKAGVEDAVAAGVRDADLVVSLSEDAFESAEPEYLTGETYDEIVGLDGVASARGETMVAVERGRDFVLGAPVPTSGVTVLDGVLPSATGEVLVNEVLAEAGLAPGDELDVDSLSYTEDGEAVPLTLQVSGVADFGAANPALSSYRSAFATTDATLREIDPSLTYDAILLDLADGTDVDALAAAVVDLAPDSRVVTGAQEAETRVAGLTGETMVFSAILLGFGAVALLTAAIVIANTFTITLAQRTGELALLRCVGATRAQVRRQVLLEAVVLGAVASAVGVLVGIAAAAGLLAVGRRVDLGIPLEVGLQVDAVSVLAPLLVGTVVTVLASLWPAARATRVSPLAALRPAGPSAERRPVGWARIGLAVLLIGVGTAAMVYAATQRDVLAGVGGGLVSFVGVLVAAVVIVPAAVRALGLGARLAGVPGRLAVDNAVRNPGRAAATSAALLVGVTLITMTSVGAATGQRTALGEIDEAYAVDVMLTSGGEDVPVGETAGDGADGADGDGASGDGGDGDGAAGEGAAGEGGSGEGRPDGPADPGAVVPLPLAAGTDTRLAGIDGVAGVVPVETAYLVLDESWSASLATGIDPTTAGEAIRSQDLVDALVPGTVGMSNLTMAVNGLEPGDTIPVHGVAGDQELTVVKLGLGSALALHEETLAELAGDSVRQGGVLVRLADDADLGDVMGEITSVSADDGLLVEGAALERAMIVQVLDVLVLVATALLGIAVVIAVVGIANTLALSVVERHREHALLRGLGLTRRQMRTMLLTEGVLLALVSAGLGLLLGVGYAYLGVQTLMPEDTLVELAVPWARVGLILGLALLAGLLASVLPARRAARVSPAAGLAAA